MYAARAIAIQDIAIDLRHRMEITSACGTVADKMTAINVGVEIVNKLLHFFSIGQDLYDDLERTINTLYRELKPTPSCINRVFYTLMSMVRKVEKRAADWVERCKSS